jgi:metal-responsive CopG/Arc/MetJ family transcriptional regulator
MNEVAKKVFASVSDQLAEKLDKRAEIEGRSLSNLISYLLERAMEDWQPEQKPSSEAKRHD